MRALKQTLKPAALMSAQKLAVKKALFKKMVRALRVNEKNKFYQISLKFPELSNDPINKQRKLI